MEPEVDANEASEANDTEQQKALEEFRALLNRYKRPYLSETNDKSEYSQYVAQLNDVLATFDELYIVLYQAINPDSAKGKAYTLKRINPSTQQTILKSFYEKGGFNYMKNHPGSRPIFKQYLDLDLKTYPQTLNTDLIDEFVKNHVPSMQSQIIPNEE